MLPHISLNLVSDPLQICVTTTQLINYLKLVMAARIFMV